MSDSLPSVANDEASVPELEMSNRHLSLEDYLNTLNLMKKGKLNRSIAQTDLMGRNKAQELRQLAEQNGWLHPDQSLPDLVTLSNVLGISVADHLS